MKYMATFLRRIIASSLCLLVLLQIAGSPLVKALDNPQDGSVGITGTLPSVPPTTGATITSPTSGQTFTTLPVTVSGLCPTGLLVKLFANNVFMGSVMCQNGSYRIQIDLFSGRNDLVARVFDALDQPGPDSNVVTVTFNDAQFNPTGAALLQLTSDFAKRGANPGEPLTWPVILSGGTGPYAISVNWGDGKPQDLMSVQFPGVIDLRHVYETAGVYTVIVKATDRNGVTAYLQLVAVANGAITQSATTGSGDDTIVIQTKILWLPALLMIPLILASFWLGRRYELSSLRKHLQRGDY